ncbi:hypothetical protein FQN60_014701 [Etheostoma spectabile]|uniref:SPT3 homolog, SAGA and STAGA complex component n=1 Tax=Etheostoma spectabile TaxID=54343 RepID=A0A5J5CRR1_9PERO|nr:hypothetical protein FQN60_014701 [Etheostoma spectabile]
MSGPMAGSAASSSKDRPASRTSFIPELQSMMFALGDARRPLHETAALVEDIRKVARLLKYLQFRDYKSKLLKTVEDEETLQEADKLGVAGVTQRRQRMAQDFLVWLDQTGELLSLAERQEVDPVKQERMERLERQTRAMDQAQYSEFCESRQLSFAKKASKFRDWLDCSSLELKPNSISMEILSYLAYETVAQIVDLSLLVKQEMTAKTDPIARVISNRHTHHNTHTHSHTTHHTHTHTHHTHTHTTHTHTHTTYQYSIG